MTTMAAMLGAVPLALGQGVGSELRRPLGIAIIGGLIFSQMLTLYTTPVIYLFFDGLAARLAAAPAEPPGAAQTRRRRRRRDEPLRTVHPPADRHDAPDRGRGPCRGSSLSGSCRCRRCPRWTFPTISVRPRCRGQVRRSWPRRWRRPLERAFGRIAGVTEMTAQSTLGQTSVTLQFDLDRNINAAARDVESAINAARSYLPSDLPANPTYRKVNPADAPIMIIALTSDTLPPSAPLRRRLDHPRSRSSRRSRASGQVIVGRQLLAGGADRRQSDPAQQLRTAAGGRPHRHRRPDGERGQRQLCRIRRQRWSIGANDQLMRGRLPAADRQLPQRRARQAVRRGQGHTTRSRPSARSGWPTASRPP